VATQHETAHQRADAVEDLLSSSSVDPAGVPRRSHRGRTFAVAGSVLALLVVATAGYLGRQDADPSVTVSDRGGSTGPALAGSVPESSTGLRVTLAGPSAATVGRATSWTVSWVDDDGSFVGAAQDWGDTGDGSTKQGRCTSTARAPGAASFSATHTWTRAGTYTVRMTVTTQACSTGAATTEDATATATVVVAAG